MYVRVLSWLWTSCDTSRYSKASKCAHHVHKCWSKLEGASISSDMSSQTCHRCIWRPWIVLNPCRHGYWVIYHADRTWDICRVENNMHTLLWRHQLVGCIPCMYIVDDLVAIKVEIDQSNWYGSVSVCCCDRARLTWEFSRTIIDGYISYGDWMHMICRGSKHCNIVELLKYLLID